MFLILNRLRGTQGLWSKVIGLLLALVFVTIFAGKFYTDINIFYMLNMTFTNKYLLFLNAPIMLDYAKPLGWFVGLGYIIGESFGWGLWVGTLSVQREKGYELHDEGEGRNNGIEWIASHIVKPTQDSWLNYCRVALSIRGFYWWLPTLAPLYFVGFSVELLAVMILALSIGFPIACEIGYYFRDKISFEKYGLSYSGGWELQEGFYGLMQDLVLITLIGGYYYGI